MRRVAAKMSVAAKRLTDATGVLAEQLSRLFREIGEQLRRDRQAAEAGKDDA